MKKQFESLNENKFQTKKLNKEILQKIRGGNRVATTTHEGDVANLTMCGDKNQTYDATFDWRDANGLHIDNWTGSKPYPGTKDSDYTTPKEG